MNTILVLLILSGVDWRLTLDDPKEYDGNVEAFEAFVEHFSST